VATVAECGPKNAEEAMMRRLILAGTVLALAAGATASAMASDQKADKSGITLDVSISPPLVEHITSGVAADLPASAAQRAGTLAAGARVTTVVLSTSARLG
jgi:hypothetical protein